MLMWGYHEYVPISQKRDNAKKVVEKLQKKNPDISPVIIEGNKIAKTWWGIAWNKNLESYADYSNRIGRGRSYVKNGFVLDLKINAGIVTALVQGSSSRPYKVTVNIAPLEQKKWDSIVNTCGNKISSIAELAEGHFPKELEEVFTIKGKGLFPSPNEIKLDCSCPDWASMCKHVAAVLYAIGARFDNDPTLFFKLRNIDFEQLLKKSVDEKMKNMLKNSNKKSKRVIEDADIDNLFGL